MLLPDQPTSTVLAVHLQDLHLSECLTGGSKKQTWSQDIWTKRLKQTDLRQVPSSHTQLCMSAGFGVPSIEHETVIIELNSAAASHVPCMLLVTVQRT